MRPDEGVPDEQPAPPVFGDFGAARLNLKLGEIPVRYRDRAYGETNIQRWKHGVLLLKMSAVAARKLKFV